MNEEETQARKVVCDEDGHDYLIFVDDEEEFEKWVESTGWEFEGEYTGKDFGDNRINGTHTMEIFGRCVEFGKEIVTK